MTGLIGTARVLVALRERWSGTLVMIGQPAEEILAGGEGDAERHVGRSARFDREAMTPRGCRPNATTHIETSAWCSGQDLNLHALRQRLLRPSCLPFHHPSEIRLGENFESRTTSGQAPSFDARQGWTWGTTSVRLPDRHLGSRKESRFLAGVGVGLEIGG